VFGARAARAALNEPRPRVTNVPSRSEKPPALTDASRAALWLFAGLERDAVGLRRLQDDPHPLVRLIGASALLRTESRGAHQRRDFPEPDPAFEHRHVMVRRDAPADAAVWT
jgi:L-aspartate oxidase